MAFLQPFGDEIIRLLELQTGYHVLDVASGTGEPGLSIAESNPGIRVTANDVSEKMLVIAAENAASRGLDNFSTSASDITALPFPDGHFDAISCRMGFMFFPDMPMALREMLRVLRPGGRIATSVWSAPVQNFWVSVTLTTIQEQLQLAPPPKGSPGMFRCAEDGLMGKLFREAGLHDISERKIGSALPCGSAANYWQMITEVGAPIVAALEKADADSRAAIQQTVFRRIHEQHTGSDVRLPAEAIIIAGQKPD